MLTDSKIRQVGFIRNSSSRKIVYRPELQQKKQISDDSFSSFQYENNQTKNIYKPQIRQKPQQIFENSIVYQQKPHIPKPPKSLHQSIPFQNTRLKNNFIKQTNRQQRFFRQGRNQNITKFVERDNFNNKFQNDLIQVKNICKGISNINIGNFTNKNIQNQFQQDYLPTQSKYQSFQQAKSRKFQYDIDSQSQQTQNNNNYQQDNHNPYNKYNKFDKKIFQQRQLKKYRTSSTNSKKMSLIPKPQLTNKSNFHTYQNDQQLVTQYKKTQFNPNPPITNKSTNYQSHQQVNQSNVYAKQGGISFQVDIKQFSQPLDNSKPIQRKESTGIKKKKPNTKDELLKRRELAKIYSKQSRFRLFGFS